MSLEDKINGCWHWIIYIWNNDNSKKNVTESYEGGNR